MRLLLMHPWAGLPSRQDLYIRLQRATGWELLIVTTERWRNEFGGVVEAEPADDLHGRLLALPVGLSGNIPLHYFKRTLKRHVRQFDPDCVYIYHEPYAVATFQMLRAAKAVTSAPIGVRSSQNVFKRYPFPFRQMERSVYRRSDFAVVVSDNVGDVMRRKGYSKPINVVPMPVDLRIFFPGPPTDRTQPLRIGYVGRLVPEKGVDTAIEALAELPAGSAELTIIGEGAQRAELRRLAASLGVDNLISWEGPLDRPAVAEAYRRLDVIVVPSKTTPRWKEQFGRVVIEAAASGVPSITTRSGELPFLVRSLGAGWTVEEGDASAMAKTLVRLGADRQELRGAARQVRLSVIDKYSDEAIVGQLVDVFRRAASPP